MSTTQRMLTCSWDSERSQIGIRRHESIWYRAQELTATAVAVTVAPQCNMLQTYRQLHNRHTSCSPYQGL